MKADDEFHELPDDVIEAELEAGDPVLGRRLAELLAAPDGLTTRTTREVHDELLRRSTIATTTDLVGLGWHTFRLLFAPDPIEEVQR